jgi:Leucine-rich repeat (LRR) protein
MKNLILRIFIALTLLITVTICKQAKECIFIGCMCVRETIKCPVGREIGCDSGGGGDGGNLMLSMFPKRRLIYNDISSSSSSSSLSSLQVARNLTIDLSRNLLEMIPDDRFAGLDVFKINLAHNRIARISPDAFRDIARLIHLDMSSNRLRTLYLNLFYTCETSLRTLKLSDNLLGDMETTRFSIVFAKLKALRELDLSNNRLVYLPNLRRLSQLTQLNLANNLIESLVDADTLENMLPAGLLELSLQKNSLKQISENWFEELVSLRVLNLQSNEISVIEENSFNNLVNLTFIDLSGNFLKHIPSKLLFHLVNLEQLDLSSQSQRITYIADYAFDRESNKKPIKKVILSNNSIETLSSRAFCSRSWLKPYANVKEIDLNGNALRELNACLVRQLAKGYAEPVFTSKLRVYSKLILNTNRNDQLLECTCDVTRANKLLDLDGFCRRRDGTSTYLNQYDCGDYTIANANQVHKYCANKMEYDCSLATQNNDWNSNEFLATASSSRSNVYTSQSVTSSPSPIFTSTTTAKANQAGENYSFVTGRLATLPVYLNTNLSNMFNYSVGNLSTIYFELLNNATNSDLNKTIELILNGDLDQIDKILNDKSSNNKNNQDLLSSSVSSSSSSSLSSSPSSLASSSSSPASSASAFSLVSKSSLFFLLNQIFLICFFYC